MRVLSDDLRFGYSDHSVEHSELNDQSAQGETAVKPLDADYRAITEAAGLRALTDRVVVRVVGDDRVTFFHGMCSADVKGAEPGTVLPALILSEHAHVIADLFIWVLDDALLLDIDADAWIRARTHLERLLVADDVEFEVQDEISVIDIEGPKASQVPGALGADSVAAIREWRFVNAAGMRFGNIPRFGAPAISVLAPRAGEDTLMSRVLAVITGSRLVDRSALETIRIENGIARAGVDTTDKTIALEARLSRAISFNKGCYVGQETIERATARGGLKKRMFGLKFDGRIVPDSGAALNLAGKEVGRVSSIAVSPRFGTIGLAILHHSAWTPGTGLALARDGGTLTAKVVDLPFK